MTTIRRTYLYAAAFLGFQTLLWGTIGLGQLILTPSTVGDFSLTALAGLLSALIVALPFYLIHWRIAQRLSHANMPERAAGLRGLYHYALMATTAIPTLFAAKDLIEALVSEGLTSELLIPLVTMVLASVAWAYARSQVQQDRKVLPEEGSRATIRRSYIYLLTAISLALTVSGAGTLLTMLIHPQASGVPFWVDQLASGLAMIIVGAPVWVLSWQIAQEAFSRGGEEAESTLRKAYLYLVTLIGSITVIATSATLLSHYLRRLFGEPSVSQGSNLATMVAAIIVGAAVWAYHAWVIAADAASLPQVERRAGIRRLYFYLLSALGLGATLSGTLLLVNVLAEFVSGTSFALMRITLSNGIAALAAGLPVWLLAWRQMQILPPREDEQGEDARSSFVRRGYLYLAAFVGAVGLLVASASLINAFLQRLLGAVSHLSISSLLSAALSSVIFGALLAYHLSIIRQDSDRQLSSRDEAISAFPVALVGPLGWRKEIEPQLAEALPSLQIESGDLDDLEELLGNSKAVLIQASLLMATKTAASQAISAFDGLRIIFPSMEPGWTWLGIHSGKSLPSYIKQAANMLEQASLGQSVSSRRPLGPWGTVGIVLVALITLFGILPALLSYLLR